MGVGLTALSPDPSLSIYTRRPENRSRRAALRDPGLGAGVGSTGKLLSGYRRICRDRQGWVFILLREIDQNDEWP